MFLYAIVLLLSGGVVKSSVNFVMGIWHSWFGQDNLLLSL